jgi:FMN phosphatase YigB (HAD superfamily)
MAGPNRESIVSLFDVDNTLLDNDAVAADLRGELDRRVGVELGARYWEIFEELRSEIGYADYLGALQRIRLERPDEPHVLEMSLFLIDYPFPTRLYPDALQVLAHFRRFGPVVIFSDGDAVFQPRKVARAGLWDAVDGNVLIYVHKEQMLADVERRYPADRYILVDDKLRILHAVKQVWRDRVTTIFPRQGHYALDPANTARYPAADVTAERIGDLARWTVSTAPSPAPP